MTTGRLWSPTQKALETVRLATGTEGDLIMTNKETFRHVIGHFASGVTVLARLL